MNLPYPKWLQEKIRRARRLTAEIRTDMECLSKRPLRLRRKPYNTIYDRISCTEITEMFKGMLPGRNK